MLENTLLIELTETGLICEKQKPIRIFYKEKTVGEYYADIIVNNTVIPELKAAESIAEEHELQLINYLKATEIELGLLMNFGKEAEYKRKVFMNKFKKMRVIENN